MIKPQPGPQEDCLKSAGDIVIFGGAAGGGKSFALLMEALRHVRNPKFGAVIFRRTHKQITDEGGLWDKSGELYPLVGGKPYGKTQWLFPSGAKITFSHLQHEKDKYSWDGSQVPLIMFDELIHFCCTPDTDVLTESGWKPIADVVVGERVVSLANDRAICLQPVLGVPSFDYDGELVSMFQKRGVSFRVTPNHRMVIDRQDEERTWEFVRADYLEQTTQQIPRTGQWVDGQERQWVEFPEPVGRGIGTNANSAERCLTDDYLELLGWYLSEGSSFISGKNAGRSTPEVAIAQTKPAPTLDALMGRLPWRSHKLKRGGYLICSRQLYDHFSPMGDLYHKRVPRWVFALSKRQQKIVFDAFIAGDGSYDAGGGCSTALANEGLVDDIQELAFYCGMVSVKTPYTNKKGYKAWRLSISRPERSATRVKPGMCKREVYVGKVHCLRVQGTNNFFMRHRGRCCWTGNSESTFWYLQTRNRSTSGVKPYIRCTCNPDAESWVADLIAWWIDQESGFPIPERSGKLRWFYRVDGKLVWGDTKQEMLDRYPDMAKDGIEPQSLTFIGSKLSDNKILLAADPGYRAKLMSQPLVEQERLLKGNWKIRPAAGLKFPRTKWKLVEALPDGAVEAWVRFWDKAATEGGTGARTAGVLMGRLKQAAAEQLGYRFIIANAVADRWGDAEREAQIKATAELDRATYGSVATGMEQEPGSGGKHSTWATVTALAGFDAYAERATTNKAARWNPMAAQQQVGNIAILKTGDWDWADFIRELDALAGDEDLDKSKLKDQADAASGAFKGLTQRGNQVAGDILASGSRDQDDRTKLTDEELDDPDTPDFIRDLLQSYREDNGGYGDDR